LQNAGLFVTTDGSKLWRAKYRFGGIENTASFGKYPQISLLQARQKLAELKNQLSDGINPNELKANNKKLLLVKQKQEENTLSKVFTEWLEAKKSRRSQSTNEKAFNSYEKNIKPWLGV
jgi:hypothetical protein